MEKKKLFYSISEVANIIKVTPQTIRNWSRDFSQLKVKVDKNNRRFFTKNNIDILRNIKKYKDKGYTIKSIKKIYIKEVDRNIEGIIDRINLLIKQIDKITQ